MNYPLFGAMWFSRFVREKYGVANINSYYLLNCSIVAFGRVWVIRHEYPEDIQHTTVTVCEYSQSRESCQNLLFNEI